MGRPGCSGCCEQEDKGCEFTPTVKFWHKNRDNDNVQCYTAEEYKGEFGDQAVDRRILEVGDIVKWQEQPAALAMDNEWKIIDTNLPNENSYDIRNVQNPGTRKVNIGRWFLLMLRPVNPDRPDTRFELPDFKGISVEFRKPKVHVKRIPELWHDGTMLDDWGNLQTEGYFVNFTGNNQVWQIIDNRGRNDLGLVEFEIKTVDANRREVVTEDDIEIASEDYEGWFWNKNSDENGDPIDPRPHPDAPLYPYQNITERSSGVRTGCSGPFFNFGNEKGTDTTHTEKAVPNDIPLSHLAKLPDPKDLQNSNEIFVAGGWLMRVGKWGDNSLMGYSGENETDEHHAFDWLLYPLHSGANGHDTREKSLVDILENGWGDTPVYSSWLYDGHYVGSTRHNWDNPIWNSYNHNIFGHPYSNEGWFNPEKSHTVFHVEDVFYSKVINQAVYHKIDEEGKTTGVKKWLEVVNKGNPFLNLNYISSPNWNGYNDPGNLSKMLDEIRNIEDLFTDDIGYIAPYGSYCINKDIAYMDSYSYYSDWNRDFYVDNLGEKQFSNGYKTYRVQGLVGGPRYVRSHKLYVDGDSYTIAEREFQGGAGAVRGGDAGTIADWNYWDKTETVTYFWPSRAASGYTFNDNSPFPDPKDDNYKYYNLYQANPGYFEGKLSLEKIQQDGDFNSNISPHHASHLFADGYLMNPRQLNDYRGAEDNDPVIANDWWDTKPRVELSTEMESRHVTPYDLVRNAKPRDGDISHGSQKLREYFDDAENMSEFKKQFWCQWSSYAETDNMQIVKVNTVDTHERGSDIHGELWSWVLFIKVLHSLDKGKGWESTRYLSGKGRGEQITGINIGGDDYWDNVTGKITESNYRPKDELEVGDFFFSKFDFKQNDAHDIEDWLVPDNHPEEERHGLIDFGLHAVEQYLWEITEIVEGVGYRAKRVVGGGNPRVFAPNQIITSVNQDNRSLLCLSAIKELDAAGAIDIDKITIDGKIAWEVQDNHLNIHWPHLKIKNIRLIEKLAKQWAVIKDANWEPQADLWTMANPELSYVTPSLTSGINAAQRRIGDPYETYFTHDAANRTDKPVSAFAFLVKGKFWKTPFYAISGNIQIIYDLDTVEEVRE